MGTPLATHAGLGLVYWSFLPCFALSCPVLPARSGSSFSLLSAPLRCLVAGCPHYCYVACVLCSPEDMGVCFLLGGFVMLVVTWFSTAFGISVGVGAAL